MIAILPIFRPRPSAAFSESVPSRLGRLLRPDSGLETSSYRYIIYFTYEWIVEVEWTAPPLPIAIHMSYRGVAIIHKNNKAGEFHAD